MFSTRYFTLTTSPGCSFTWRSSASNFHASPALEARSSTVTSRLASTCVFTAPTVRVCVMPIASQIWRYIGTIAKPKPSMPHRDDEELAHQAAVLLLERGVHL